MISQRTKVALAAAKARGTKLGAPVIHLKQLLKARTQKADAAAQKVASVILPLKKQGVPLRGMCVALNSADIKTERSGQFHPSLLSRMLKRLGHFS